MNRPTGVALLDQRSELRAVSSIFVCHRLDAGTPPLPHPLPPTSVSKTYVQPTDTRTVLLQPRIYRKSKARPDKRPDGESLLALSAGCRIQGTLGTARVRLGIHFCRVSIRYCPYILGDGILVHPSGSPMFFFSEALYKSIHRRFQWSS